MERRSRRDEWLERTQNEAKWPVTAGTVEKTLGQPLIIDRCKRRCSRIAKDHQMFRNIARTVLAADGSVQSEWPARMFLLGANKLRGSEESDRLDARHLEIRNISKPFRLFWHRVEKTRIDAAARTGPVLSRFVSNYRFKWSWDLME